MAKVFQPLTEFKKYQPVYACKHTVYLSDNKKLLLIILDEFTTTRIFEYIFICNSFKIEMTIPTSINVSPRFLSRLFFMQLFLSLKALIFFNIQISF